MEQSEKCAYKKSFNSLCTWFGLFIYHYALRIKIFLFYRWNNEGSNTFFKINNENKTRGFCMFIPNDIIEQTIKQKKYNCSVKILYNPCGYRRVRSTEMYWFVTPIARRVAFLLFSAHQFSHCKGLGSPCSFYGLKFKLSYKNQSIIRWFFFFTFESIFDKRTIETKTA